MKSPSAIVTALCAVALLSGCSVVRNAQQNFQQSFHQNFRKGFRTSFLKSCETHPGMTAYCQCAVDDISNRYSDNQLMTMTASDSDEKRWALQHASRACASKLP